MGMVFADELEVAGCQNADACNFNPDATDSDDGCVFAEDYLDCDGICLNDSDGDGVCDELEIEGCTDATACNFLAEATEENDTCEYLDATVCVAELVWQMRTATGCVTMSTRAWAF